MFRHDVDTCLATMQILVDTREQPTRNLQSRLKIIGFPSMRRKLDVGDYSCICTLPDGDILDFSSHVVIERKMNIDELCLCFGKERQRFRNEFERARESGTKVYLLVENANWEKIYNGCYRSKYNPKALVASIDAFRARYDMQIDFCKTEITGNLIRDILYRELREYLERI